MHLNYLPGADDVERGVALYHNTDVATASHKYHRQRGSGFHRLQLTMI